MDVLKEPFHTAPPIQRFLSMAGIATNDCHERHANNGLPVTFPAITPLI
jgi:hypothetical protein